MGKAKVYISLFLMFVIIIIPFGYTNAHSVQLDPDSLISMPMFIFDGSAKIDIKSSVKDYTLYFQAVKVENSTFAQMEKIKTDGDTSLKILKESYTALKTELDNLKETYDTASTAYAEGLQNSELSAEELKALESAYETAKTNYQNKGTEYNDKINEYNNKVKEINSEIAELTPMYIESNWTKTTDNKISIDTTQFSGTQSYAVWAKLVTSSGTYYNETLYTIKGTKPTEINIAGVTLDKSTLSLTEGSSYTLTATIAPSDATDKTVTWKSDNEDIASVENGKVTAKSVGTATITVTSKDGGFTSTCTVTVTKDQATQDTEEQVTPDAEKTNPTKDDTTVAAQKLPQTGVSNFAIIFIISLSTLGIIFYNRYKYLNIK